MPTFNRNQETWRFDNIVQINNASSTINSEILARSNFKVNTADEFAIPIFPSVWRVHDALATDLPTSGASNDDLALVQGAFGTSSPSLQTNDFVGASTIQYARALVPLPAEYVAASTLGITVHAGMLTTVATVDCSLDVECYVSDEEAGVSADICATAAQDINSLTLSDYAFTFTATGRAAGEILDIRLKIDGDDTGGTSTARKGFIGGVTLTANTK